MLSAFLVVSSIAYSTTNVSITSTASNTLTTGTGTYGDNSVSVGNNANATMKNSVAVGSKANATGETAVAVGFNSQATAGQTIAIGSKANATNVAAIGIGLSAKANGYSSIALGREAIAGYSMHDVGAIALGNFTKSTELGSIVVGNGGTASGVSALSVGTANIVTGSYSGAIGTSASFNSDSVSSINDLRNGLNNETLLGSLVSGESSYSIGNDNKVSANKTFVLGNNITADVDNSVYLGDSSYVSKSAGPNSKIGGEAGDTTTGGAIGTVDAGKAGSLTFNNFAGATSVGGVTVGASGSERRIQNVAAGEITEKSTDAVNGSQLYSVAEAIDKVISTLEDTVKENTNSITNLENTKANKDDVYTKDEVYNKDETDAKFATKADASDLAATKTRVSTLESRVNHLDTKLSKSTAMMAAMSNVDFGGVGDGEIAIGAGFGGYVGEQAVAVGVGYGISDYLKVHAKWSAVAGDAKYNTYGGGITYKFKTR